MTGYNRKVPISKEATNKNPASPTSHKEIIYKASYKLEGRPLALSYIERSIY